MEDKKQKATKDNKHYLKALMAEIKKSKKNKNIEEMRVTVAKIYNMNRENFRYFHYPEIYHSLL